ncbi:DedA family protein [Streptomyces sp. JJ38]|uniref:DedA family protein n=1 Tax=Streptomyces sp. JJ38 TaxID=2738128 RepID=UPI001C59C397|nr:DedA family protein [Streptomyces sp. JJ38]MBW1599740.1 DedA family protein [Streptomyces sp. JJ38]
MVAWLAEHAVAWGALGILAVVLVLPALEAALPVVGVLVPGQTALVVGGVLSWHGHVPVVAAIVAALVGGVLGNVVGYVAGRRWRARVPAGVVPRPCSSRRLLKWQRRTERGLALIERRGGGAVFIGRFTGVLRTVVPTLCGAAGMPLRRYVLWTVLSSATWAPVFVLAGYALGPAGRL